MEKNSKLEFNRTGIEMSPIHAKSMIEGAESLTVPTPGNEQMIIAHRENYLKEAEPIGKVPVPTTLKGALLHGIKKLQGLRPELIIDKIGERLAFERSGIRLYDALIGKCEQNQNCSKFVSIDVLRRIRDEEYEHFTMLRDVMQRIGADPTAMTPSADVTAMATMGIEKVILDTRTSLKQSFEAILITELTDNECWGVLIGVARISGLDEEAEHFMEAYKQEQDHLRHVRSWIQRLTEAELGVKAGQAA